MIPLLLAAALQAAPYTFSPNVPDECRVRDGLPNVLAKLTAGETVRVAYLGGSITEANGWRPKSMAWFKATFPTAKVEEINVAISGTGSDFSALRAKTDMLGQKPDLVFLECWVNGGGGYEQPSVEGVVRQVWRDNPRCDICFVYTVGQWMIADLQNGKAPWFTPVMETIANAYGIPTVDFGLEVAKREKDGSLVFKAPGPIEGKLVFSADGVHPGDAGHDIYRDVLARSILSMKGVGQPGPHSLPAALGAHPWEQGELLPVDKQTRSAGWLPVDTNTDVIYREDYWRTHRMLRGATRCDKVGETITVRFDGTTVGLSDIPYGQPTIIEVSVDGGPAKAYERKQTEARKHARFFYLPELPPGPHTVVYTVKELPAGQSYYAGELLIVGKLLP